MIEKLYVPPELRTNRRAPRICALILSALGLSFSLWGILEMKKREHRRLPVLSPRETPHIDEELPAPVLVHAPFKKGTLLAEQVWARSDR